ncbi:MAG TPA: cytochrome c [Rhodocyclaceae bacterium]|nr:cytochrome c [Rhodocyclaceae bacterium]
MLRRPLIVAVVLSAFLLRAGSVSARLAALDPIVPPAPDTFTSALVEHGAQLAAIGNCASCHTARGGAPYAGGLALTTPFGKIYSSNVTPDPQTGIGTWSEKAFARAMREGVSRGGRQLYPAFPYDHFTHTGDDDLNALYAFLMTRDPQRAKTPSNELHFPFGFRPLIAGWKWLFFDDKPFQPDPEHDAEWNRGAYLAQSLGHCGSCHTPRNALGAEKRGRTFDGGETESWYAPPLNAHSPSPQPWTVAQMTAYLRTGIARDHAIAGGPMREVTIDLAQASEADVQAIATYVISIMDASMDSSTRTSSSEQQMRAESSRQRSAQALAVTQNEASDHDGEEEQQRDARMKLGASVYANTCASCHDAGRGMSSNSALRLPLAIALYEPDPRNLLHIIRDGIKPADGESGRWMPDFNGALTNEQLVALAAYLRHAAAASPPWPDLEQAVKQVANEIPQ